MPSKCLFVDLDNTLYSYDSAHLPAQKSLEMYLSRRLREKVGTIRSGLSDARLSVKSRLGDTASSHSRLIYISEFLRDHGCQSYVELAVAAEALYWANFFDSMVLYDGVENFLLASRHSGYKNILVTDQTAGIQLRKLRFLGIDGLFEIVLTSEEAGGDKNTGHPEKYLAQILGEVEGISIGDGISDHLFRESTIFFKKVEASTVFKSKKKQVFFDFVKLQKQLFPTSKSF